MSTTCGELDPVRTNVQPCRLDPGHTGNHNGWHAAGYPTEWPRSGVSGLAQEAFAPTIESARGTFQSVFKPIYEDAFNLLVAKQRSYGSKNVEELGFFGIFSRLASDKIERLRNGLNGRVVKGRIEVDFAETLADESLEDTLVDVMNYAAILIALKRGQWGAPLEEDL